MPAENDKDVARSEREVLLGESRAKGSSSIVEDELLGRPYAAQVTLANEGRGGERRASTPEERFALLKELASAYMSAEDVAMLEKAFRFASEAHAGQCRKSGEPFVAHPVEVAIILVRLAFTSISLTPLK